MLVEQRYEIRSTSLNNQSKCIVSYAVANRYQSAASLAFNKSHKIWVNNVLGKLSNKVPKIFSGCCVCMRRRVYTRPVAKCRNWQCATKADLKLT